jgi:hypothetical protein
MSDGEVVVYGRKGSNLSFSPSSGLAVARERVSREMDRDFCESFPGKFRGFFLFRENMFRIAAATIAVRKLRNYTCEINFSRRPLLAIAARLFIDG